MTDADDPPMPPAVAEYLARDLTDEEAARLDSGHWTSGPPTARTVELVLPTEAAATLDRLAREHGVDPEQLAGSWVLERLTGQVPVPDPVVELRQALALMQHALVALEAERAA